MNKCIVKYLDTLAALQNSTSDPSIKSDIAFAILAMSPVTHIDYT